MNAAAQRAGMPLDQWLRQQLFGKTAAGNAMAAAVAAAPPAAAPLATGQTESPSPVLATAELAGMLSSGAARAPEVPGSVAELQRRIEELSSQIDHLGTVPAAPAAARPDAPPAPQQARSTGSSYADQKLEAAIREIDQRLEAMNLIVPRTESAGAANPRASSSPAASTARSALPGKTDPVESAVAEIAARQRQLDGISDARPAARVETNTSREAPLPRREDAGTFSPATASSPYLSARSSLPPRAGMQVPSHGPSTQDFAAAFAAPSLAGQHTATLGNTAAPLHPALTSLHDDLAAMRQSLAGLAPRHAVDELQRVVRQLAERMEGSGSRDEELRATLLALRDMIGGLKRPEQPAILLGRIETLERKLDIVNAKIVDGATIARLQAQAGEIRDLLARSLSSDSVRLLAEQVALMAGKLSEVAASEEKTLRAAVGSIESRIDALSEKIASQPAPSIPMDDLIGRLDAIQSSLAAARREAPAGMEAMFKELSGRIADMPKPEPARDFSPRFDALDQQVAALAQKIDKAAPGTEIAGQLAGIERAVNDLFIQMEETRATLLATGGRPRAPAGPGANATGTVARIRREISSIESARSASPAAEAPTSTVIATEAPPVAASQPLPAPEARAVHTPAPEAHLAENTLPEVVLTPQPASIPKPFEPHLMRAALEELDRSAQEISRLDHPATSAPAAQTHTSSTGQDLPANEGVPPQTGTLFLTEELLAGSDAADEAQGHSGHTLADGPIDLDAHAQAARAARGLPIAVTTEEEVGETGDMPSRTTFIAQARRASQPAGAPAPEVRSHIIDRHHPKPKRWLARIRAMLLIGMCGSAMAYGSWHLLGMIRESQLRAAIPAFPVSETRPASATATLPSSMHPAASPSQPSPDDITGSIRLAPAPVGPSSLAIPTELPGNLANPTLRTAALSGDPAAAYEVGRRFMEGIGIAANPVRAAEWFSYASTNGSVPATYRLGTIYEKGMEGVPRDVIRARNLYESAASAGNVAAMHNLGVLLAAGINGQPDYRTAALWFTRAAERGLRDSQYNLAVLYARGFGVKTDLKEAWRWFALAAARGDSEAALKRDEIAARLDKATLAAIGDTVENWKPLNVDSRANDNPNSEWEDTLPRKTASR